MVRPTCPAHPPPASPSVTSHSPPQPGTVHHAEKIEKKSLKLCPLIKQLNISLSFNIMPSTSSPLQTMNIEHLSTSPCFMQFLDCIWMKNLFLSY